MNSQFIRVGIFVAIIAPQVAAQPDGAILNEQVARIGLPLETDYTGVLRDSFVSPRASEFYAIFHAKDHTGWGDDPSDPGVHRIDGVRAVIDDSNALTANRFFINFYPGSTTQAGVPNFSLKQSTGPWFTPIDANGGQISWVLETTFPTPIRVSNAGDVYISHEFGFELPSDFLRIGFIDSIDPSPLPNWDRGNSRTNQTGHGLGTSGGYGFFGRPGSSSLFWENRQFLVTPLSAQAAFKVGMRTSQTSMPSSNVGGTPGYTTSLFSSRKPVMVADYLGNARGTPDEPVLIFADGNRTAGDPIVFFMTPAFGGLPTPVQLSTISGWTGTFCLPTTFAPIDVGQGTLDTNGEFKLALTGVTNPGLVGFDFAFTGIALDTMASSVHFAGCELVQF